MNDRIDSPHQAEQTAPLSFAQQRLWLLDRLMPPGSVYNIEHVLRLSGELDHRGAARRLERDWCAGTRCLRTRFGMQDGQPVQVIAPELRIALAIEDLRNSRRRARGRGAATRAGGGRTAPFDLGRGPAHPGAAVPSGAFRALVAAHPASHRHRRLVIGRAQRASSRHCTAPFTGASASPLPPLPVQYADYALWQRQWLQGPVLEQQLAYWRQALAGLPTLDLPTDRPRPAAASYRGGCVQFEVPESLTRSLKELSRREGATLFMTLLAAYQVLLFRYSGQEDIAVGVPIAGRTRPELEGSDRVLREHAGAARRPVGRAAVSGTYLAQVRDRALDAYSHQDLPFEKLVEELAPKRDLSRNPLFQASLVLQNTPPGRWHLPGLDVRTDRRDSAAAPRSSIWP